MATHTHGGDTFPGRTFGISRENGEKKGRPYFFEWISEIPAEKGNRKFESRTSETTNKVRHFELFTALSGFLTNINLEQKSFGDTKPAETWLVLYMHDAGEDYKIQVGEISSRYSMDVMKRLLDPNFDPMLSLRLSPFALEGNDGKPVIGLAAHSGADGKLEAGRDCAHLQGSPQAESREWKGKVEWDFSPIAEWLFDRIQKEVLPNLGAVEPINTKVTASPAASAFPVTNRAEPVDNPAVAAGMDGLQEPDGSSDLPF